MSLPIHLGFNRKFIVPYMQKTESGHTLKSGDITRLWAIFVNTRFNLEMWTQRPWNEVTDKTYRTHKENSSHKYVSQTKFTKFIKKFYAGVGRCILVAQSVGHSTSGFSLGQTNDYEDFSKGISLLFIERIEERKMIKNKMAENFLEPKNMILKTKKVQSIEWYYYSCWISNISYKYR